MSGVSEERETTCENAADDFSDKVDRRKREDECKSPLAASGCRGPGGFSHGDAEVDGGQRDTMPGACTSPDTDTDRGAGRRLHRVQAATHDCRDVIPRHMVLLFPCVTASFRPYVYLLDARLP